MASYIDPSFRESLLKSAQNRTAQVNKYYKNFKLPRINLFHIVRFI